MHFLEVLEVLSMRYERTEERDDRVYIGCNCTYKVLRSSLAGLERSVRIETRCVIIHEHFTDAQSTCVPELLGFTVSLPPASSPVGHRGSPSLSLS